MRWKMKEWRRRRKRTIVATVSIREKKTDSSVLLKMTEEEKKKRKPFFYLTVMKTQTHSHERKKGIFRLVVLEIRRRKYLHVKAERKGFFNVVIEKREELEKSLL